MSAIPSRAENARESVAGLMASAAIFASLLGLAHRPVRIIPVAVIVALVSARMTSRYSRLAGLAVAAGIVCWVVGMTIAVVTKHPLF